MAASEQEYATASTVVALLRADLNARLTLAELADALGYSPFHLARLFRRIVGLPPGEFRAALRFDEAKRLLVREGASVTDACFAVGFDSLGTFSTRFRRLVGLSPQQFVRLPDRLGDLGSSVIGGRAPAGSRAVVRGHVHATARSAIYLGLFPHAIARSFPVAGSYLPGPGPYELSAIPPGRYRLLAAGVGPDADPLSRLVSGPGMSVGAAAQPVVIRTGTEQVRRDLRLRAMDPCEPPILVALAALA